MQEKLLYLQVKSELKAAKSGKKPSDRIPSAPIAKRRGCACRIPREEPAEKAVRKGAIDGMRQMIERGEDQAAAKQGQEKAPHGFFQEKSPFPPRTWAFVA